MNGVVACTLTEVSTKKSCILRFYKTSKQQSAEADPYLAYGQWDWIGGTYRPHEKYIYSNIDSGRWHIAKANFAQSMFVGGYWDRNVKMIFAVLTNVPSNFLDIGAGETARGLCEFPNDTEVSWSMWFRAA